MLTPRQFDGKYLLQLAEILVFSGPENVALRKPLRTSSNEPAGSPAWDATFLVDGSMPYLMNSALGDQSLAFVSEVGIGDRPLLTIDLETSQPISEIHLHAVDQSDTVPQSFAGDFGIPRLLRIEGANEYDYSDATVLTVAEVRSRVERSGFRLVAENTLPARAPYRWSRDWTVIEACRQA